MIVYVAEICLNIDGRHELNHYYVCLSEEVAMKEVAKYARDNMKETSEPDTEVIREFYGNADGHIKVPVKRGEEDIWNEYSPKFFIEECLVIGTEETE